MREYFPLWRALPKLCIAASFTAEIFLLILGEKRSAIVLEDAGRRLTAHFSGASLLVALILLFVVIAGLGLFILDICSALLQRVVEVLRQRLPYRGPLAWLSKLDEDPFAIALRVFKERRSYYLDFLSLKSSAMNLENLDKRAEIDSFVKLVGAHLDGATPVDIEAINFYGMLAQDRRAIEIVAGEISSLINLVIVLLLFPAVLWPLCGLGYELLGTGAALAAAFFLLQEIRSRKLILGRILLAGHLDFFCVAEGAEVSDREGEPIL
jgi:hypothetical protein